jgi:(p)ppGpp synthase/HD superfamily hydrolase
MKSPDIDPMTDLLPTAMLWANRHHASQEDKLGFPYIAHVADVANRVSGEGATIEIIGWLHDIVEDTPVTLDEIDAVFGPRVAAGVNAMTRRDGESYFGDYLPRLSQNPDAVTVKIADASHNWGKVPLLRERDAEQAEKLDQKYRSVLSDGVGGAESL